jgi:hypothetical protein
MTVRRLLDIKTNDLAKIRGISEEEQHWEVVPVLRRV